MLEPRALSLALLSACSVLILGALVSLGLQILKHAPRSYTSEQYYERALASRNFSIDRTENLDYFQEIEITAAEAIDIPPDGISPDQLKKLHSIRRNIEDTYGFSIRMFNPNPLREIYGMSAITYSPSSLETNLASLEQWLAMYPPEYIRLSGLQYLYLFRGWEKNGIKTAGFLLDRRSIGISAVESVFHHELFHIADITDGGIRNDNYDWLQAKYGTGKPQNTTQEPLTVINEINLYAKRPFGFVSTYGKEAGTDEDQATVAAMMFTDYGKLAQWARVEPPLRHAMRFLQEFYYSRSDGKMDQLFWEKLESGEEFHSTYWATREEGNDFRVNEIFEEERLRYQKIKSARIFALRNQWPQAVQLLRQITTHTPEKTAYILELGELYEDQMQFARAIAFYNDVLPSHPDPYIHVKLALNYAELHKMEKAMEHYNASIEAGILTKSEKAKLDQLFLITQD